MFVFEYREAAITNESAAHHSSEATNNHICNIAHIAHGYRRASHPMNI